LFSIDIQNVTNAYDYEELIKIFLRPDQYQIISRDTPLNPLPSQLQYFTAGTNDDIIVFNEEKSNDKNYIKRQIFLKLKELTGFAPPWGILTGVRPVKLTGELYDKYGDYEKVREALLNIYLLSPEKANLLIETRKFQEEKLGRSDYKSCGLYIGIPFCPTRCLYCSFTSNQKPESEILRYLEALKKEIRYVGKRMKETGIYPESIYIGGGTPTTLSHEMLDDLMTEVEQNIDLSRLIEYTVEAGRPDTITKEKIEVIKKHNAHRISINPQTMKDETLKLIGRDHSSSQILEAFGIANEVGDLIVNCDLITGLPKEEPDDFSDTLNKILELNPNNITVHTLAVKRASRLIDEDPDYHYRQGEIVKEMLNIADTKLRENGYKPYYLYRQKHMAGSFENVGWCKNETPSVYNVRIMEEKQHILALGAGGISKIFFPEENRLERVPNVSNYEIYIDRIDEMIERKENNFFKEVY